MSTAEVRPNPEEHLVYSQNYGIRLQRLVLAVLCGLLVGFCVFCLLTTTTFKNTSEHNEESSSTAQFQKQKQEEGDDFLTEMDYKDGSLTVKQDGIYYLYSKVAISESQCEVKHTVKRVSQRYGNGSKPMDLMKSMRHLCPSSSQRDRQNLTDMTSSYLGGVFHLFANDSIFVTLNVKMKPGHAENIFGAFML